MIRVRKIDARTADIVSMNVGPQARMEQLFAPPRPAAPDFSDRFAPPPVVRIPGSLALLDALPDPTAVLAYDGTILTVNRAWRRFARDHKATAETTGVGVNYIDVCSRSAAAGCPEAGAVEAGLYAVLNCEVADFELEYPCPSDDLERWFVIRITQINGSESAALVSHINISHQKLAERELQRKASQDPLTGLANPVSFQQALSSALLPQSERTSRADVGLLFIDLDGFKQVNDRLGHSVGDDVLRAVASRLNALSRPQDTIARLGGDEFAIVAPRVDAAGLGALVERIAGALRQPHDIEGNDFEVGASVGSYLAARGESAEVALRRADRAMYAMKHGAFRNTARST